eukprot:m.224657 g.224657  ORF g.224657 m.224657 type:complete len:491 (+) comp16519_c0_seq1:197-1669(+)
MAEQKKDVQVEEEESHSEEEEAVVAGESQPTDGQAAAKKKKKKKKKNKAKQAQVDKAAEAAPAAPAIPPAEEQKVAAAAREEHNAALSDPRVLRDVMATMARLAASVDPKDKEFKFWHTQPVPKLNEKPTLPPGPIEGPKEVPQDSLNLPEGFQWVTLDIDDERTMDEVYTLLRDNYVEDDGASFRFDYSKSFLQWALKPPGWRNDWHVGVRAVANQKLLAFISAIPAALRVDKVLQVVEINFLCVHKKLRTKRLAPVLIQEITRRVNLQGIFQAVYTAGALLPRPVSECIYYHRSLNPEKLIDIKFSHLPSGTTMARHVKKFSLPDKPENKLRPMRVEDVGAVTGLLNAYLSKFKVAPVFTEEEVAHWFVPRKHVISCYVHEKGGRVTDFVSYYTLPSTVMNHPEHKHLSAAYLYYTVGTTLSIKALVNDALIIARSEGYDVFNALNLMDNEPVFEPLLFGKGDGNLRYYLFNYRAPPIKANELGLVLL